MNFINNKVIPWMFKLGQIKRLIALRNGMTLLLPFTITGSIFLILGNLPIPGWSEIIGELGPMLNVAVNATYGMLAVFAALGVAYYLGREFDIEPISLAVISLSSFMVTQITPELGLDTSNFGATGLFMAIICAFVSFEIYRFVLKKNLVVRMPKDVPPAVANSFLALTPAILSVTLFWVIRVVLGIDINAILMTLFQPFVVGLDTIPGLILFSFLITSMWVVGIHGDNVLAGVSQPIMIMYLAENAEAYASGDPIPHIVNGAFYLTFMCVGGTGATLGLVLLSMFRTENKSTKEVGKLALPSGIFCINEPIIFGYPIVFNPIMWIPFILTPIILGVSTYLLMYFDIIGKVVMDVPWTTPPILNAFLCTGGNIPATIWSACEIVISMLIFYPFFRVAESRKIAEAKKALEEEQQSAEAAV